MAASYKKVPLGNEDAISTQTPRPRGRDPADLLPQASSIDWKAVPPVKAFNTEDLSERLDFWNGFTLVDLEDGLPDFHGEDTIDDRKEQLGGFACRTMAAELKMKCGVMVRHMDVPYIEAKGQLGVALQLLWVTLAAFRAVRRWRADCDKILAKAEAFDVKLSWSLKGKWLLGAFWENLFPSPVTLLSARRVLKRQAFPGGSVTILGYASKAGFQFRYNRGAQSLWPTLILEDLPLLCLQIYIYTLVGRAGPVFFINSALSFISAVHKGSVLWEQNKNREIYRKEILDHLKDADEQDRKFFETVYMDEFGSKP